MKAHLLTAIVFVFAVAIASAQPAYVFHQKGMDLFNAGKYSEAIKEFDTAIKKEPGDFESLTDRGRAHAALGKPDLAIADYTAAIKANPNYQQAYFYRAVAYEAGGKDQLALPDFTKVVTLVPEFSDGYVKRGMLYYKTGQTENALKDLTKGIELRAKNADVFFSRAEIYRNTGKDDAAIKDYTSALEINPQHVKAYFNRGVVNERKKKYPDAIADYSKAIELKMNTEEVYQRRAASYIAIGKKEEALKDYSMLIDVLKTKDVNVYVARGTAFNLKGDYANAVKDLSRALTTKKDDPNIFTERGYAYLKQGKSKYGLATNDFNKALELQANNFTALLGLGQISFETNKFEQGIDYLTRALKIKPDADAHYIRSKCYYKTGNNKMVCEDLQKAAGFGHKEAVKDAAEMCR